MLYDLATNKLKHELPNIFLHFSQRNVFYFVQKHFKINLNLKNEKRFIVLPMTRHFEGARLGTFDLPYAIVLSKSQNDW